MNVVVELPDDFAIRFGSRSDLGRRMLEALALDEYRAGRLSKVELQGLLDIQTRVRLDGFLKENGLVEAMTMQDFDDDLRDIEASGL